jgi:Bacterial Ig domain
LRSKPRGRRKSADSDLVAGGGPSTNGARVINFNTATPTVTATAPMAFGRRQHNVTVLADGSVLATGGNSSGAGLVDLNNGVYAAELWNPTTGQWKTLAAEQVTRVEFRDGTTVLGQDTTAPYSYMWRNVSVGSYVLTVRATDNSGALTTSAAVNITVRLNR